MSWRSGSVGVFSRPKKTRCDANGYVFMNRVNQVGRLYVWKKAGCRTSSRHVCVRDGRDVVARLSQGVAALFPWETVANV
jgi:hypothetical protein